MIALGCRDRGSTECNGLCDVNGRQLRRRMHSDSARVNRSHLCLDGRGGRLDDAVLDDADADATLGAGLSGRRRPGEAEAPQREAVLAAAHRQRRLVEAQRPAERTSSD